ncbi:MAG: adenylosuccinate lyase family protein [Halanaeroarchaeum sp.]
MLLQIREGLDVVERDLDAIVDALERLTREHADTPMIGRTWHVHALPITFGLKTATWLDEIRRHRERLDDLRERLFSLQFFGAVGSLASLGEDGLAVQAALADELDLSVPDTAWFAARDRIGELVATLAMIASSLGKIAEQVLFANRPEVAELREPIPAGNIGSSTMPHKRNPFRTEEALMLSRLVRSHAGTAFELMGGDDERDGSTWFAEFAVVPEAFLYTSRILESVHEVLADLVVDPDAMRANLDVHGGLVTSEAVMMALAETVGRQKAHDIVHEAAGEAIDGQRSFAACLCDDERVESALGADRIERLTDPTTYTGLSERLARRTVE